MKCNKEKFVKLMAENFFNNETLAKEMGVNVATVSKLKNGRTTPQAETLKKLCTALNCKPSDLLE